MFGYRTIFLLFDNIWNNLNVLLKSKFLHLFNLWYFLFVTIASWNNSGTNIIEKYVELKKSHSALYFSYKELSIEYGIVKKENENLKHEIQQLKNHEMENKNKHIEMENKQLHAEMKQIKRISKSYITPQRKTTKHNEDVFEVEQLINHRGRKPNREFLVRSKGYDEPDDTWETEANLNCPKILADYIKRKRLCK